MWNSSLGNTIARLEFLERIGGDRINHDGKNEEFC